MDVTIVKGYTFGSTELVTNTKLHTMIDSATVSAMADIDVTGVLTCVCATASGAVGCGSLLTGVFTCVCATASGAVGCGSLLIGQTPTTATASAEQVPFTCDSLFTLSLNGTTYYIPCASATA